MKDLDFDELDRAISSVLENKTAKPTDPAVSSSVDTAATSVEKNNDTVVSVSQSESKPDTPPTPKTETETTASTTDKSILPEKITVGSTSEDTIAVRTSRPNDTEPSDDTTKKDVAKGDERVDDEKDDTDISVPVEPKQPTVAADTPKVMIAPVTPSNPGNSMDITKPLVASSASPVATRPVIAPRTSINRSGDNRLIDVMAPSQRTSRQAPVLQPSGSLAAAQPSSGKTEGSAAEPTVPASKSSSEPGDASPTEPVRTLVAAPKDSENGTKPEEEHHEEVLKKPAGAPVLAPLSKPEDILPVKPAPKPEEKAPEAPAEKEDSFTRFDTLSRSGIDFNETDKKVEEAEEKPAEPAEIPEEPEDSGDNISSFAIEEDNEAKAEADAKAALEDQKEPPKVSEPSPFLANAVVEKRPLGAAPASSDASGIDPDKHDPGWIDSLKAVDPVSASGSADKKDGAALSIASPSSSKTEFKTPAAVVEPDQQSPLFDTNEYHAPITGAKQKDGGKGLLIVSIVMFVLACGAVAAVFFFGDKLGL